MHQKCKNYVKLRGVNFKQPILVGLVQTENYKPNPNLKKKSEPLDDYRMNGAVLVYMCYVHCI